MATIHTIEIQKKWLRPERIRAIWTVTGLPHPYYVGCSLWHHEKGRWVDLPPNKESKYLWEQQDSHNFVIPALENGTYDVVVALWDEYPSPTATRITDRRVNNKIIITGAGGSIEYDDDSAIIGGGGFLGDLKGFGLIAVIGIIGILVLTYLPKPK